MIDIVKKSNLCYSDKQKLQNIIELNLAPEHLMNNAIDSLLIEINNNPLIDVEKFVYDYLNIEQEPYFNSQLLVEDELNNLYKNYESIISKSIRNIMKESKGKANPEIIVKLLNKNFILNNYLIK